MPMPGGYWLWPSRTAVIAASSTSGGPSSSGKPWPRLMEPVATANDDISAKIVVPKPCIRSTRCGESAIGSAGDEAEAHVAARVVTVEVDEHDALPDAEERLAVLHRQHHRRRDDRGQHVVGTVAGRAVRVAVAVVARQQALERVDQVVVGPRTGLHDGD